MIVFLVACSADTSKDVARPHASYSVRDSAGIRIAESSDSAWTTANRWRVEDQPYLQIGSRDGQQPGTAFGRIGPIARLSDGRFAVADLQSLEIRIFDTNGLYLAAWGGRGSGPGELQRIDAIAVINGDSLVVRNDGIFRHEVFAPNGSYGRTVRAPPASWLRGGGQAVAWLEDGSFILGPANVPLRVAEAGRVMLHGEWHLFDSSGDHVALLERIPERLVESTRAVPLLYGARAMVTGTPEGLWYGFPATFEVKLIGPRGLHRIVRRTWSPSPVSGTMRAGYVEWYQRQVRVDVDPPLLPEVVLMRRLESQHRGTGAPGQIPLMFADTLPAFIGLLTSTDGHIYVRLPAPPNELERHPARISTNFWSVFDPDGRWLGTVTMPIDLDVRMIGADYVLGVWKDAMEVEYVRLHRLIKPAGNG
ncbi:MAG TPA: hypothetical protein VK929_17060 [Longimicrobiales bacterium]|nr:hypothetical protein [Longimicrobiales bacterium]